MTKSTGTKRATTPERVAERVDSLIRSIRGGLGGELAEHNAAVIIGYIEQVHNLGIITAAQFEALVAAVNEAADNRLSRGDRKEG